MTTDHATPGASSDEEYEREVTARANGSTAGHDVTVTRLDWAEFWQTDTSAIEWLVEPIIPSGRNVAIVAKHKVGKSLVMLLLLSAATLGRRVLDRPSGEPLRVVYLDYEMTAGDLQERLLDMGYDEAFQPEAFAYYLHPALAPLDTPEGGRQLLALALAHRADVVVIDTFGRAVAGPEDSSDTIRDLFRHTVLPLKAHGMTAIRLDHVGHSEAKRARGSSGKGDDVDVALILTKTDAGFDFKTTISRMTWMPDELHLRLATNPLRLQRVADSWPSGTAEVAAVLDRLGVPLDVTQREAGKAVRADKQTVSNDALRAAIRWRRQAAEEGVK